MIYQIELSREQRHLLRRILKVRLEVLAEKPGTSETKAYEIRRLEEFLGCMIYGLHVRATPEQYSLVLSAAQEVLDEAWCGTAAHRSQMVHLTATLRGAKVEDGVAPTVGVRRSVEDVLLQATPKRGPLAASSDNYDPDPVAR